MTHTTQVLTRPVGRRSRNPKVFYESFAYQAQSRDRPRRVVAKVEWHGHKLFPRVGFIVTNRSQTGRSRRVRNVSVGRGCGAAESFAVILNPIPRFGISLSLIHFGLSVQRANEAWMPEGRASPVFPRQANGGSR